MWPWDESETSESDVVGDANLENADYADVDESERENTGSGRQKQPYIFWTGLNLAPRFLIPASLFVIWLAILLFNATHAIYADYVALRCYLPCPVDFDDADGICFEKRMNLKSVLDGKGNGSTLLTTCS